MMNICFRFFSRNIPWPDSCDCPISPPKRIKGQDLTDTRTTAHLSKLQAKYYEFIQESFITRTQKGYNIHNEGNTGFKDVHFLKDNLKASYRTHAIGTIQINEKYFSECIILQLIMSKKKLNTAENDINLSSDEISNYKLSDIELMDKINEKCNKATYNITHHIIHNINLKKDNFKPVTSPENDERDISFAATVSTSPVRESIVSMDLSENSTTIISTTKLPYEITTISPLKEYNINLTTSIIPLGNESKYETSLLPEEMIMKFNVTVIESNGTLTNITTTENVQKTTITNYDTSLYSLPDLITTDYTHHNSQKLSNEIKHTSQLSTPTVEDVVKENLLNDINYKQTANEYYVKIITNNETSTIYLDQHNNETTAVEVSTGNQLQYEMFLQTFNTLSNNYSSKGYDNNTILFTRNNHYRDRYNESNIPIVRIITQEYPNDTVSSIINGNEILPNNDFKDEINGSKPYAVDFKTQGAKVHKIYSISINKEKPGLKNLLKHF